MPSKLKSPGTVATLFETKTPCEPSVKLAQKATWPTLLKPLGQPLLLPVGADEGQIADRAEVAGCHFQLVALADDELQGAGPIGRPDAVVVGGIHARRRRGVG